MLRLLLLFTFVVLLNAHRLPSGTDHRHLSSLIDRSRDFFGNFIGNDPHDMEFNLKYWNREAYIDNNFTDRYWAFEYSENPASNAIRNYEHSKKLEKVTNEIASSLDVGDEKAEDCDASYDTNTPYAFLKGDATLSGGAGTWCVDLDLKNRSECYKTNKDDFTNYFFCLNKNNKKLARRSSMMNEFALARDMNSSISAIKNKISHLNNGISRDIVEHNKTIASLPSLLTSTDQNITIDASTDIDDKGIIKAINAVSDTANIGLNGLTKEIKNSLAIFNGKYADNTENTGFSFSRGGNTTSSKDVDDIVQDIDETIASKFRDKNGDTPYVTDLLSSVTFALEISFFP